MSDDGRLELDDDGAVVGSATRVLDLHDPSSTAPVVPTPLRLWWDANLAPWVGRHRLRVRAGAVAAVVVLVGGIWWTNRPPILPPVVSLDVVDAVLKGNDISGPLIDLDGTLSVAYSVRALTPGDRVDVRGLVGPGLSAVPLDDDPVLHDGPTHVTLVGRIGCDDPALASARPSSYALDVRRTDAAGGSVDALVSLGSTTSLDLAVLGYCLDRLAPQALRVESVTVAAAPGSPVSDVVVGVHNVSAQPLTVSLERRDTGDVELDLSASVAVAPGSVALLATRLLVHDCSAPPALPALGGLPNPSGADSVTPGITLRVSLGGVDQVASYPLTESAATNLGDRLASACSGRPTLATRVVDAQGSRAADGRWSVIATYALRSSGVGFTVGREHFVGPDIEQGSTLTTVEDTGPGTLWATVPTRLDGGAGRLDVEFAGHSCADVPMAAPPRMAVRVKTSDGRVYPFEVVVDDGRILQAAYDACGYVPAVRVPAGWVMPDTA